MQPKLVTIKCLTCGEPFMPKSPKNVYCRRSCFKKAYWHRQKARELSEQKFPTFTCPSCGLKITLDFDPSRDTFRWLKYQCPGCSVLMISVCEEILTQDQSIV